MYIVTILSLFSQSRTDSCVLTEGSRSILKGISQAYSSKQQSFHVRPPHKSDHSFTLKLNNAARQK